WSSMTVAICCRRARSSSSWMRGATAILNYPSLRRRWLVDRPLFLLRRAKVSTERIAVYPGSFDPITNGHLDILLRSLRLFDRVIVALADNVRKKPMFTVKERKEQILASIGNDPRVEVDAFSGLLVSYVQARGARFIVRGLRATGDFEYEFQL